MYGPRDQTAIIGHPPEDSTWPDPSKPGLDPDVHPLARLEAFVTVDSGTERPTSIGAKSWLLKHVHVGHDALVGDRCVIATGTVIGGFCELGDDVRVGLNATVLPYRKIGAGAHIGAGAVVTRDVPAGETWVGNPARKLEDHERDPRPHSERRPGIDGLDLAGLFEAQLAAQRAIRDFERRRIPMPQRFAVTENENFYAGLRGL